MKRMHIKMARMLAVGLIALLIGRLSAQAETYTVNQALVSDVTSSIVDENTLVEDGTFTATYTATAGWISSVYTNGAPAYDCSAKPTEVPLALTGIASDINIVVATSKTRPTANKWFENPSLTVDFAQVGASSGDLCAGFHWGMDATDDFLAWPENAMALFNVLPVVTAKLCVLSVVLSVIKNSIPVAVKLCVSNSLC